MSCVDCNIFEMVDFNLKDLLFIRVNRWVCESRFNAFPKQYVGENIHIFICFHDIIANNLFVSVV